MLLLTLSTLFFDYTGAFSASMDILLPFSVSTTFTPRIRLSVSTTVPDCKSTEAANHSTIFRFLEQISFSF